MNIIIIGAGRVGINLAQQLEKEHKHHITIIDVDKDRIQDASNRLDVLALVGSGTNPDMLIRAGISDADILIAVTQNSEINILSCHLASKFQVKNRVARIESSQYMNILYDLEELGVTSIIEPQKEITEQLTEYLLIPETTHIGSIKSADLHLRGYKITHKSLLADRPAKDIAELCGTNKILHIVIIRNGETIIPMGDTIILPGDELLSLIPNSSMKSFRSLFGVNSDSKIAKVVITGSSSIALRLAKNIESLVSRLILISEDKEFCLEATKELDGAEIILGDPASEDILNEVGISTANYFVPVDNDSEENIIAGLLAKSDGAEKVVAVTNQDKHTSLFRALGIDRIVHPSKITTGTLYQNITGFSQASILQHVDADLSLGHFIVSEKSGLDGFSIINLRAKIQADFIVGGIFHKGIFSLAQGNSKIYTGDKLIIFYGSKDLKKLTKLFRS